LESILVALRGVKTVEEEMDRTVSPEFNPGGRMVHRPCDIALQGEIELQLAVGIALLREFKPFWSGLLPDH
jgi:hypothetical protein